ncbi:hypothetical protein [Streptomyces sp. SID12488]|uniref:hypothetical protein n=1 Tax=Streptomyces sp. SID12488 TaxID=2706040 RepID=UPI0013D92350|nr:hypothetical protein [Streptomyces sp. SID12488]NEA62027.1 hypothetical protein [Streptomyces sp. SID12488]
MASAAIDALQGSCRDDPSAFGLRDAACEAGARLSDAMETLAAAGPSGLLDKDPLHDDHVSEQDRDTLDWQDPADAFVAELTRQVGGEGGTMVDAALRRAIAASAQRLLTEHPDIRESLTAPGGPSHGTGLAGDLLCLLYQWFFADLVTEFLRAVIAEKIKLTVPVLEVIDAEGRIADGVAERIIALIPNPCEEAEAQTAEAAKAALSVNGDSMEADVPLSDVARRLVPGVVGKILGFAVDALSEEEVPA